jgi:acyl-CoA thioester hydrolase
VTTEEPDPRELRAADFAVLLAMTTRWSDNDVFGHLNNAVYYQLFDSAINRWIGQASGLDPAALPAMGVVAESSCRYLGEVAYPQDVQVGLAVVRVGTSSVTYRLGLFGADDEAPAAVGRWVHVYVDRGTRRPVPLPDVVRTALAGLAGP